MDFKQSFQERLIRDLEDGRYGSGTDFARGITKHYMSAIKLNAPTTFGPTLPAQIPLTLPAPTQLGAPAPVGPTISISYKKTREKLFYNTVRAYFVGKEITQGNVQIRSLTRDVKGAINEYKRVTREIQSIHDEVDRLEDQFEALKEDLRSILPEMRKFIESKKQIIKDVKTEFDALKTRFRQLGQQELSDFDFETVLAEELQDLEFFTNLKIKPSLRYQEITETFNSIKSLLDRSQRTLTKYQNTFTKEANLKIYVRKKITAVTKEILDLLSGIVAPERFIRLWKELVYVPGGRRISAIMLRIINQNKKLKELKKKLLAKVEGLKRTVLTHVNKKIDDLLDKLKEMGEYVVDRLKIKQRLTKFKEKLKASKIITNIIKATKQAIKYITKIVKHINLVLKEIFSTTSRIVAIYNAIQAAIQQAKGVVDKVKQRYRDIDTSIDNTFSEQAREARQQAQDAFVQNFGAANLIQGKRPTEELIGQISRNSPLLTEVLRAVNDLLKLNNKQLAAFLRTRTTKVSNLISQIDYILTRNIPRLQILLTTNPNASNYKQRLAQADKILKSPDGSTGVASVFVTSKGVPKTYLFLVKQTRKASLKLKELQDKMTQKLKEQSAKLLDATKNKDAVLDYIDTILDKKPKLKKIRNKKRRIEQRSLDIRRKIAKYAKLARQARAAYRLLDGARNIVTNIAQNKKTPISSNERATRTLVSGFCDLQIDRGKMTKQGKKDTLKRLDLKLADLRAYEAIYTFFGEIIKEAKAGDLGNKVREELGEKISDFDDRTRGILLDFLKIIEGTAETPTISALATIPTAVFQQTNVATAFVRAEKRAFKRLQSKTARLSGFIPTTTTDPVLLFVKRALDKTSSIVLFLLKIIGKAFRKIEEFLAKLLLPVSEFVTKLISEQYEKVEEEARRQAQILIDRNTNLDARIMTIMFGIAGRLFWSGATWTNTASTRFVVTNIGKFRPRLVISTENGSQGFGEELARGFNNQLKNMTGIIIPPVSTGIVPFTFRGYVPLRGAPPTDSIPGGIDTIAPLNVA